MSPQESSQIAGIGPAQGLRRLGRGLLSGVMVPFFPLGRVLPSLADRLDDPAREGDGLTLVLTGIQGRSFLELQLALGLADAGVPGRIEIVDWTTGNLLRMFGHLRDQQRAADQGRLLADRIVAYRQSYPEAPVRIVGYSGGGYVALLLLEALPPDVRVTHTILLAASCSPYLDVAPIAAHSELGLVHCCSRFDVAVLGLLTLIVGTTDKRHSFSAGMVGFASEDPPTDGPDQFDVYRNRADRFREIEYRFRWFKAFHFGGHFGYANRVWAGEILGRLLIDPNAAI